MDSLLIIDTVHPADLKTALQPIYAKCTGENIKSVTVVVAHSFTCANQLDDVLGYIYTNCRASLKDYTKTIDVIFDDSSSLMADLSCYEPVLAPKRLEMENVTEYEIQYATTSAEVNLHTDDVFAKDYYKISALGGTFDHIHDGHKILLSVAAFLTSKRLIVGVTDQELLANKKYKQFLQPFYQRVDSVLHFLKLVKPSLESQIVPIRDVCGPTGTVPEIEALIVSEETVSGAGVVNKTRQEKGMNELQVYVVNVLGGGKDWKEKLSSTYIRELESSLAT